MDSQDQRKTHTPGQESHGVHVCHKCGWPFPNPHPSAKHRRAHKKICGTIEGYKLCASEGQTRLNGSDDEHVSDDDHKSAGPKALDLDIGDNEKGNNNGIGEKINRSEDEVFSDAVADFSDSGLSQGVKEHLQEGSLDSGTSAERVDKGDPKFSGSSEENNFNDADVSPLTVESKVDCQIQHPEILQGERVEVGNTLELQGQLSRSTVDPLSNSIADLRAEESSVVHSDDIFGLSTEPHPSKAEAMPDVLPENKIYASENLTECSLTYSEVETNLKGKHEIKSDRDKVEIVVPSYTAVGETCEGESKIAVSDVVYSDHHVTEGAINLKEEDSAEFLSVLAQDVLPENKIDASENVTDCSFTSSAVETNLQVKDEIKSDRDEVEIVVPSDVVVGETCEGESKIAVGDAVYSDHQVAEGAVNLKENHSAEFLPVLTQDDPPLGSNAVVVKNASTNDVQVESARVVHFADSSDVKILQEREEGNVNANALPISDDRTDAPHPQSEYEDVKDHEGVVSQNSSGLHSSESLKPMEDDLKDTVKEENNFLINPSQLTEKSDGLSPDMLVMDSSGRMNKELVNSEPMAEEMHTEEHTEVSSVKPTVESSQRSDENGVSMNAIESEVNEGHMVPFSEEQGPVDVENPRKIILPESTLMGLSNENPRDASFGTVTSETISVVSIDNTSHHEENRTEINDVAVDGKDLGANLENDIGTQTNDLQPSDLPQLEVKQSKVDVDEMDKIEKVDVTDAQFRESASYPNESPVISEAVVDEPTGKSTAIECTNGSLSGAHEDIKEEETNGSAQEDVKEYEIIGGTQEDVKEDAINGNVKVHEECNRSVGTSANLHQARDAELLMKDAEDLAGKNTSLSSLNAEPSARHDLAVKDDQDGHLGSEGSGITAVPVQDQSVNDLVKHSSSGIDASVDYSSRCDSLEANWGSVSVLSMQSDAPAIIDAETSPATGLERSTEAGKSNLNNPKGASERQQSGKSEMFEAPSFMTLVEPSHKAPASEGQKGKNPQQSSSTLQTGWFPSLTQVTNESQGRNKNEEIIAKVTNWSTSKEHTPLKSLLGEAAHSYKPTSPKLEENSVNRKNGKVPESNGSGLTTVNSILGPESPAAQGLTGDAAREWNSPARYPAEMKREKRKVKSRPYWIQLVCCSSVDLHRR